MKTYKLMDIAYNKQVVLAIDMTAPVKPILRNDGHEVFSAVGWYNGEKCELHIQPPIWVAMYNVYQYNTGSRSRSIMYVRLSPNGEVDDSIDNKTYFERCLAINYLSQRDYFYETGFILEDVPLNAGVFVDNGAFWGMVQDVCKQRKEGYTDDDRLLSIRDIKSFLLLSSS